MAKQCFGESAVPLSPAVRAGDFVFVSGQVPFDADGVTVKGGITEQTEQVLENLRAALALAGCTLEDVVKTTVWLEGARAIEGLPGGDPTAVGGGGVAPLRREQLDHALAGVPLGRRRQDERAIDAEGFNLFGEPGDGSETEENPRRQPCIYEVFNSHYSLFMHVFLVRHGRSR